MESEEDKDNKKQFQQPTLVLLQSRRNGFIEQYIFTEEQLEEQKMQQEQREMNMKPWEREI